jgi:predicted metal-dependent peptidase
MGDYELRKINYVLQKLAKRSKTLHIVVHDYEVVLSKKFKKKIEKNVNAFIKKRYSQGGTSHRQVFDYIANEVTSKDVIYISFSDNYSDIESLIGKYSWSKYVNCYWVTTEKWLDNTVPGTQIHIDDGKVR